MTSKSKRPSWERLVYDKYMMQQGGCCFLCGITFVDPERVSLVKDFESSRVLGVACGLCWVRGRSARIKAAWYGVLQKKETN